MIKYVLYILCIIGLLMIITLPLHNRCMLQYTIFIPLIYFVLYAMNGEKSIITTIFGKINNRDFIPGILNINGIDISDNTLDIIQNIGLTVLSLLAGFKLSANGKNDKTKLFFTNIYNKLGRY
jgi:hypothetical protein